MEQRIAFLYGYYSEDPNYPEGVRVNVEAIYEPPQIGEFNGVQELEDPSKRIVDTIAHGLSLELVGWMFTSLNQEVFLTSAEIRKIARFQEQHLVDHPEGYKVSKFVTVVAKPSGPAQDIQLHCYQVSDQCQALERDSVFGESESNKKMVLRECSENEMMPSVLQEGKPAKEFELDFFIVSLNHGSMKEGKDFNICKFYDFPVANRSISRSGKDFKEYIKRHKSDPATRRYACFHFLVYLAERLDPDTAFNIATCMAEEKAIDPALVELLE